ncbi:hypothetical protein ESCO_005994 [Escovopsis weberi]|uniref:Uncharacterized protein n=1 Tax=Escovopsis weberi TaxID=150374 RepID=A0A0M8MYV4_ESCWE|nr:hypothetical protein ESCO_005994 [Escovopsis weberi]
MLHPLLLLNFHLNLRRLPLLLISFLLSCPLSSFLNLLPNFLLNFLLNFHLKYLLNFLLHLNPINSLYPASPVTK